jgi:hypothetical protein
VRRTSAALVVALLAVLAVVGYSVLIALDAGDHHSVKRMASYALIAVVLVSIATLELVIRRRGPP